MNDPKHVSEYLRNYILRLEREANDRDPEPVLARTDGSKTPQQYRQEMLAKLGVKR